MNQIDALIQHYHALPWVHAAGLSGIVMLLLAIYRTIKANTRDDGTRSSLYTSLSEEVTRLNAVVRELGTSLDEQRKQCDDERRDCDERMRVMQRDIARLTSSLQERDHVDELGRKGQIERRKTRLEVVRETTASV